MNKDLLKWRSILPMGAVKETPEKTMQYAKNPEYCAEIKYDGCRYLSWFDKDKVRFTSRTVSVVTGLPSEKTDNVPHLRDMKNDLYGTILDGEIFVPGGTSHNVTSIMGALPEQAIKNQEEVGKIHYMVYDILQYKGESTIDLPYINRIRILENAWMNLIDLNEGIAEFLHLSQVFSGYDFTDLYNKTVDAGGEGLILKHRSAKYYPGEIKDGKAKINKPKASKKKGIPHTPWIKMKKYNTHDVVIMGFHPATIEYTGKDRAGWCYWQDNKTGNKYYADSETSNGMSLLNDDTMDLIPITKFHYYGWPGAIIFGQFNKKGELVEVGQTSGITDEMREDFATNPDKYIGEVAEVGAMEKIKKTGALREPRFIRIRDDKNDFECLL